MTVSDPRAPLPPGEGASTVLSAYLCCWRLGTSDRASGVGVREDREVGLRLTRGGTHSWKDCPLMEKPALRGDELPVTKVGKPRLRGRLLDTWRRSSFIWGLHLWPPCPLSRPRCQ